MNTSRLDQPARLVMEGNVADNWRKFLQRFKIYINAIGLRKSKDEDKKIGIFLHVAGDEAIEFFNTIHEDHQKNMDMIIAQFEAHCCPLKNETLERYRFNTCSQQPGDSIQQFVTKLKTLAATCEFDHLKNSLIRDRIICGIRDTGAREKLLSREKLTLEQTLDFLITRELARERSEVFNSNSGASSRVKEEPGVKEETNVDAVNRGNYTSYPSVLRVLGVTSEAGAKPVHHGLIDSLEMSRGESVHSVVVFTRVVNIRLLVNCAGSVDVLAASLSNVTQHQAFHVMEMRSDLQQYGEDVLGNIDMYTVDVYAVADGALGEDWFQIITLNGVETMVKLDLVTLCLSNVR